jgi:dipeptide/tripeptide permease
MKWTWTIRDLLIAMLLISLIAAWYWNHLHGRREFNLWMTVALGTLVTPVAFYRFAHRRQAIVLFAGFVSAFIVAYHLWLIANL